MVLSLTNGNILNKMAFFISYPVPNEGPPGLTAENWGTTHSVVIKWQSLPPSNEYGILAGYRVRYRLTAIGEESVTGYSEEERVMSPVTNQVLLENLVMYGTYSVWVSAFTIKGDGPASFTYAGQQNFYFYLLGRAFLLKAVSQMPFESFVHNSPRSPPVLAINLLIIACIAAERNFVYCELEM